MSSQIGLQKGKFTSAYTETHCTCAIVVTIYHEEMPRKREKNFQFNFQQQQQKKLLCSFF